MPNISTILILTHSNSLSLRGYFVNLIAKEWETQGIRVLIHRDLKNLAPADVCFLHVDLSVVPPPYTAFARLYPNTVNLHVTDIRKTGYSRNLVVRGDGYDGPIIVKSSLNHGGEPERRTRPQHPVGKLWRKFHRELTRRASPRFPFQQPSITNKQHYRVFAKRRMLPIGWLDRHDIVVERFRPEQSGDYFVLREWFFLGDQEYYNCELSRDPIFTSGTHCPALEAPPPDLIRQVRKEFQIDYGKIDYVIDCDGTPVLFDVNKTIGLSDPNSERARMMARILANGLTSLVT